MPALSTHPGSESSAELMTTMKLPFVFSCSQAAIPPSVVPALSMLFTAILRPKTPPRPLTLVPQVVKPLSYAFLDSVPAKLENGPEYVIVMVSFVTPTSDAPPPDELAGPDVRRAAAPP